ncbi:MAG: flavodoxin-dependent (E)-4-hydroxy-3-methylbut-2-enyl-diphosphate synthase, partial [Bacilli bacterium]|nr:flavodoxin-dependent (E)-4-hydroxy-3-methylbut-2-enyl-diphosphate synthase [Bacilli bacterium]
LRDNTRVVKVGNVLVGGGNPISIQSMTTTPTKNIIETIKQIKQLELFGCDIVRVAVLDEMDANAIKEIKKNISIPLVADIHFDYKLALIAIENGIDKLRINPGNIGDISRVKILVEKCKEKGIPIRIGVNSGSLEKIQTNIDSISISDAMIESAKKHVQILESLDFYDIIISLKSSNVEQTIETYEKASKIFPYPLHLGVTESGPLINGCVKSTIGLFSVLRLGIGDTIRVSLSNDPIYEVKVAKEILKNMNLIDGYKLISCPTCGRTQYNMLKIVDNIEKFLDTLPKSNIKVAIMGCVVNGPGEAKEADVGIAGGNDCAVLFKKGKIIQKLSTDLIEDTLKKEILDLTRNKKDTHF